MLYSGKVSVTCHLEHISLSVPLLGSEFTLQKSILDSQKQQTKEGAEVSMQLLAICSRPQIHSAIPLWRVCQNPIGCLLKGKPSIKG